MRKKKKKLEPTKEAITFLVSKFKGHFLNIGYNGMI